MLDFALLGVPLVLAVALPLILGVRDGLNRAGLLLLGAGLVAMPWSAVRFGGATVGDLLLLAALVPLTMAAPTTGTRWLPAPMLAGASLIAFAGALSAIFPPTQRFLNGRFIFETGTARLVEVSSGVQLAQWFVALLGLPVAVALATRGDPRRILALSCMWLIGIEISAAVAVSDYLHLTSVSPTLIGFTPATNRQAGLTGQPNNIGVQAAMVAPLALYLLARSDRRLKWLGGLALVGVAGGVVSSGSRGGAVGTVIVGMATMAVLPALRPYLRRAAMVGAPLGAYFLFRGNSQLLGVLRLGGDDLAASTARSNEGRRLLLEQGLADWLHRPLQGIGFQSIESAHMVYVQLLGAGGLLTFIGFGWYVLGTIREARPAAGGGLWGVLALCTAGWLIAGLVENQLTDRYLYVPMALLAATTCARTAKLVPWLSTGSHDPLSRRLARD